VPGIVTLSIELELGWGMHDCGHFFHLSSDRSAEDRAFDRLLDACDRYDIPLSIDVVSHLFHESCSGIHEGPYPNGWWRNDPGTTKDQDPLFYAPDLIGSIAEREVDHEFCTHTYSHVLANEIQPELLELELERSRELHVESGLPTPTSIVMPRHLDVDYEILTRNGIDTIRTPIRDYGVETSMVRKWWWLLTRDHPLSELRRTDEMVETYCTPHPSLTGTALPTGQLTLPRHFRFVPRQIRVWLHRRYLEGAIRRAAQTGGHVHLWTHLYNMANDVQWRALEPALANLARARDRGKVIICPMAELDQYVASSSSG